MKTFVHHCKYQAYFPMKYWNYHVIFISFVTVYRFKRAKYRKNRTENLLDRLFRFTVSFVIFILFELRAETNRVKKEESLSLYFRRRKQILFHVIFLESSTIVQGYSLVTSEHTRNTRNWRRTVIKVSILSRDES